MIPKHPDMVRSVQRFCGKARRERCSGWSVQGAVPLHMIFMHSNFEEKREII
jgi:hypothetical protein